MIRKRLKDRKLDERHEDEKNREDLFRISDNLSFQLHRKNKQRDNLRSQAHKTTESLNSLVSKMSEQVQRSEDTTSTLIHSSAVLHETHNQFNAVGATIRVGGKMISKYARRENTDKFLIGLALLVYFGVILWVLKKRVWIFSFLF
uniref:Sec20 C-terminal domain-containing protein n=1 Tax=Acrobeloides nanus TaxID=290746 RepID=A0A914BWZ7_9BILA